MGSLLTPIKFNFNSAIASLEKNILMMVDAFPVLQDSTHWRRLIQSQLAKSVQLMLSASGAQKSPQCQATGVQVNKALSSSTAISPQLALALVKVTSILRVSATKDTRAFSALSANQAT